MLNWNGWRDTIECLESVLRLDYPDYLVVVCDNASSDGSMEQIRGWARGDITVETRNPSLAGLVSPPVPKPIAFAEIDPTATWNACGARLLLIQTGANRGFAGGNNVGLKYALQQGDCDFAWILNNDTVVLPDALSYLVQRMVEKPDAGICGSTLLYYDAPSKVQACAGSVYNKWVARGGNIGRQATAEQLPQREEIERKLAYVVGASMLVRKSFLDQVGLMNEQYFLTFEEIDWATRAKDKFRLAYAPHSVVYHKEGGATGSHWALSRRNPLIERYAVRNRVLFTRTFYPMALTSVLCAIALSAAYRLLRGRWKNAMAVMRGASEGLGTTPIGGKLEV